MSGAEPAKPPPDDKKTVAVAEPMLSPQMVIGLYLCTIAAATIAGAFFIGDKSTIAQVVGGVMTILGTVAGFYFGSSKGSQSKDAALAAAATPPTTGTNP